MYQTDTRSSGGNGCWKGEWWRAGDGVKLQNRSVKENLKRH